MQSNEFSIGTYHKTPDGLFILEVLTEWNSFQSDSIYDDTIQANTVITDFKIMNKSVEIGDFGLTKNISHSDSIVFSYYSSSFSRFSLQHCTMHHPGTIVISTCFRRLIKTG
ncbi:MAG: hypothetical protein HC831_15495 [Chloroflexia bacterium]|nr:hypothetical protein [Chloroflexia bacterium]